MNRPGRKHELDDFDDLLSDLNGGITKVLRLLKNASPYQLKHARLKFTDRVNNIVEKIRALYGESPSSLCNLKADTSQHTIRYKAEPAGLHMIDLARKTAWDLGLGDAVPPVFDLRRCTEGENADIIHKDVWGMCRNSPGEVFVRADLGYRDTIETLGHEMFHAWERHAGRAANEVDAEQYGRKFARSVIDGLCT